MESVKDVVEILLHLDKHFGLIIRDYGSWTYMLLFVIIFCETGLVVITPFLPGETLLFAAGTFASLGLLDEEWLIIILSVAAITGDNLNYWLGYFLGPKALEKKESLFFSKEHITQTHEFYRKYGGNTIIIARFIPFIRTFSPFVAGIGRMSYKRFTAYDIIGGVAWILTFVLGGYFFGRIPLVKNNFIFVIIAVVLIAILPALVKFLYNIYLVRYSSK
jgi:membrane-associated protein